MRNLKRTLSMLLAVVMVLGLMITGAGAVSLDDFSDRDEIVNDEAVLVLTTLNVINGKSDGSYDPKGTVTRGEMAKMICVILNGGAEPVLAETVNNSYTDTVGHWAARYIEYCTTLGIVAGRGDKKFDPDGEVSVAEAGKMLLVALGYNAGVEGYVGANWQINTDVRANQLDIYDGMEGINTSTILTRDNAALMCYNALDVHMVTYEYIITGDVNNAISTKPQLNDHKLGTLLEEKFGAAKVTGVVLANEFANLESTSKDPDRDTSNSVIGSALDAGKTRIVVNNYEDGQDMIPDGRYTFNVSTGEDVLGRAVNLYVKPARNSNNMERATVIGSVIISEDNKEIVDASGDDLKDVLDDNNLTLATGAKAYYNYAQETAITDSGFPGKDGMTGIQRTLIDTDGDNDVDCVLYREMRLGKVTLYTDADKGQINIAVNGRTYVTKDKADIAGFENVAKDDYVLTAFFGGVLHVQQAETVTGKINAYKQTDKKPFGDDKFRTTDFTLDGENYTVSRVETYTSDITAAIREVDKTILGSDATFYLDESGNVIAYGDVDESAYKYALLWGAEAGSNITSDRVKVTLENGTTGTYTLNSNSDIDIIKGSTSSVQSSEKGDAQLGEDDTKIVGMIFGYNITSNGEIKLYLTKGGAVTGQNPEFNKGLTRIKLTGTIENKADATSKAAIMSPYAGDAVGKGGNYYSNNATTFFYVKYDTNNAIDKVTVYNGRNNAPSVKDTAGKYAYLGLNAKGDVAAVAFLGVTVTENAEDHLFVYKPQFVSEDYVTLDTFMGGQTEPTKGVKASLYSGGTVEHNPDVEEGIYLYTIDSDGNYELTKPSTTTTDPDYRAYYFEGVVAKTNKNSSTFRVDDDEFRLDSKSIVIDYASNKSNPVAVAGGTVNEKDKVQIIVNNDDDRVVLMVAILEHESVGGSTGVDIDWDGKIPAGIEKIYGGQSDAEQRVQALFSAGKDAGVYGGWILDADIFIPAGRTLYVENSVSEKPASGSDPAYKFINNGTLMVEEDLATLAGTQVSNKDSSLVVKGDWTIADDSATTTATATNGKVVVAGTIKKASSVANLTIAKDSNLEAGAIDLGNNGSNMGVLTVNGHAEVNGNPATKLNADITAYNVKVASNNTLIVQNELKCAILTVGDGTNAGRVEVKTMTSGKVVVKGTSSVNVTDLQGSLDLTDAAAAANLNIGTTTSVTLTGTITNSITLSFNVTIDSNNVTLKDGVKLTFNGTVKDPDNLTVEVNATNVQIAFGSGAKVEGNHTKFVGQNTGTLDNDQLAGTTFTPVENGNFGVANSNNPKVDDTYTYGTGSNTTTPVATNSKHLY